MSGKYTTGWFKGWNTRIDPREHRISMNRGTELVSRRRFLLSKAIVVAMLLVGLAAFIACAQLLDGPLKWIAIAFLTVLLPIVSWGELIQSYGQYRGEWHEANPGAQPSVE